MFKDNNAAQSPVYFQTKATVAIRSETLQSTWVRVTPSLARVWFEHNTDNRTFRETHGQWWLRQMKSGQFASTHQGIAFDRQGVVLDGQHRLWALAQMPDEYSVLMLVTVGMDRSLTWGAIDVGAVVRTYADVLGVHRQIIQVAMVFAQMAEKQKQKYSPHDVHPYVKWVMPELEKMHPAYTAKKKVWCAAPVLAGCVWLAKRWPEHMGYVIEQWQALIRADFDSMYPSTMALYRLHIEFKPKATVKERFASMIKGLNPHNRDQKLIRTHDAETVIGLVRDEMRKDHSLKA